MKLMDCVKIDCNLIRNGMDISFEVFRAMDRYRKRSFGRDENRPEVSLRLD